RALRSAAAVGRGRGIGRSPAASPSDTSWVGGGSLPALPLSSYPFHGILQGDHGTPPYQPRRTCGSTWLNAQPRPADRSCMVTLQAVEMRRKAAALALCALFASAATQPRPPK